MRRRQLTATLAVVLAAVFVLGLPLLVVSYRSVADNAKAGLLREAEAAAALVTYRIEQGQLNQDAVRRMAPQGRRVIVTRGGRTFTAGKEVGGHPYAAAVQIPGGTVTVQRDRSEVEADQLRATALVLSLSLLAIGVAVTMAVLTARRLSIPLGQLAERAGRLGSGDFRTAPHRYDIDELRLAELVQRERDMVGDISHQIRSRLTALSMRLEEVAASDDPHVRTEALAALDQADRLSGVVDELLAQAREKRAEAAERLDVATELARLRAEWEPAARAAGRELVVRPRAGLTALATPGRLHPALGVLVENAFLHGGGTVRITTRATEAYVVIEVSDEGAGVDPKVAPRIFNRGVSGGQSTGIGLALARALVDADGGRLELRLLKPATFAVFLTRADDTAKDPMTVASS
jgi:signal transduction histidine kinase